MTTQLIEGYYEEKYDDLVRMYSSRAGPDDVEDVVQEAFYRALKYIHTFNLTYITVDKWLSGILNNCLSDMLKEKRDGRMMHDSDEEPSADDRCPSDTELEGKILKHIGEQVGAKRHILWLYFKMGYKNSDIHQIVGGSYVNVDKSTSRFKAEMQDKYGHLMVD